jgi:hypothetical protein
VLPFGPLRRATSGSGRRLDLDVCAKGGEKRRERTRGREDQVVNQHAIRGDHRRSPVQTAPAGLARGRGRYW